LIALGIAAGFHLIFFSLFHIAPFKIKWGETLFTPVEVEAESPTDESEIAVDLESSILPLTGLPPQKNQEPMLAAEPALSPPAPLALARDLRSEVDPFASLEKPLYEPSFNPLPPIKLPPLSISISGPLTLAYDPLEGKTAPKIATQDGMRVVFKILIDASTGFVIWYEMAEKSESFALNRFAEEIIKDLHFTISAEQVGFIDGQVELMRYHD
jgi:hypothetical protein